MSPSPSSYMPPGCPPAAAHLPSMPSYADPRSDLRQLTSPALLVEARMRNQMILALISGRG